MKANLTLYFVRTDDYDYLFTENELRDFIESELNDEKYGLVTVENVKNALGIEKSDEDDDFFRDLSGLTADSLCDILEDTDTVGVQEFDLSNYAYEMTIKDGKDDYHLQRIVLEDLGHFSTREAAENYMQTHKGLMNL